MTLDEFLDKAKKRHGEKFDYSLVLSFKNNKERVKVICKTCGRTFETTIHNHLLGFGCPYCAKRLKTTEDIVREIIGVHGEELDCSQVVYQGAHKKVRVICNRCGLTFLATPHHLIKNHGCPNCKLSRGEKTIRKWLTKNDIRFESQKRFEDCKDEKPLPFDFYLPDFNLCVEYQGEQHYKPRFFVNRKGIMDGIRTFEKLCRHDEMKRKYCKKNNIRLLEITYRDNIEEKLKNSLPR